MTILWIANGLRWKRFILWKRQRQLFHLQKLAILNGINAVQGRRYVPGRSKNVLKKKLKKPKGMPRTVEPGDVSFCVLKMMVTIQAH